MSPEKMSAPSDETSVGGGRPNADVARKGIYWILAGLVVTGVVAAYDWLRVVRRHSLPNGRRQASPGSRRR